MIRRPLAIASLFLAPMGLLGCAAASSAEPAPTVTVTTTATPTAIARSEADALTGLDAWLLCYGATSAVEGEASTLNPYDPELVTDNGDGSFEVNVAFTPSSGEGFGAESVCVVSGTVGEPVVDYQGARDFG